MQRECCSTLTSLVRMQWDYLDGPPFMVIYLLSSGLNIFYSGGMDTDIFANGLLAGLIMSAFLKVALVLTLLRLGLGLRGFSFNILFLLVAIGYSVFVMAPSSQDGRELFSMFDGDKRAMAKLETFVSANTSEAEMERAESLASRLVAKRADSSTPSETKESPIEKSNKVEASKQTLAVKLMAFIITQVREAFELGLLILIPFLIIDLAITNVLMLLGVTQIETQLVAVPLKILLFTLIGGWDLFAQKLVGSFS